MTFKHAKFEDSPVMRSLEKVAQQKGLVKNESVKKTAAATKKTASLIPTENLLDNVLKLCSGLRERGFTKQAEDLEANLVNYKKAQTMYDTHGETGEDVIHSAHPKGSHKLEGVDAANEGAVVEDILDQMAKSIEMVNKKPTGKLSEAEKAIQAVKVTLGARPLVGKKVAADELDDLYAQAATALQKFTQIYENIKAQMGISPDNLAYPSGKNSYLSTLATIINKREVYNNDGIEDKPTNMIDYFEEDQEPGWFDGSDDKIKWKNEILPLINVAKGFASTFQNVIVRIRKKEEAAKTQSVLQQYNPDAQPQQQPKDPAADKVQSLIDKFTALSKTVGLYQARMKFSKAPNLAQLNSWLGAVAADIAANVKDFSANEYKTDDKVIAHYQEEYDDTKNKLDAFQGKYNV